MPQLSAKRKDSKKHYFLAGVILKSPCLLLKGPPNSEYPSSTEQIFLVLRIFDLQSRNSHEQARLSLHENARQQAGEGNLPRMAQGRAESTQRQAERGSSAENTRKV
jgi:hypothetical protein